MIRTALLTTTLLAASTLCLAQGTVTQSANGTILQTGSGGSITDSLGNTWTISSNALVQENGKLAGYSKDVTRLVYVNGVVWQQNNYGLWWPWDGINWPGYGIAASPLSAVPTTPASAVPALAPSSAAAPAAAVSNPCPAIAAGTGGFSTQNGQIIGPNGQPFVARGINIMHFGNDPSLAQVQAAFPGVNFIRLAIYHYDSPSSLAGEVDAFTNAGIVVELEDHTSSDGQNRGGGTGVVFSGPQLINELGWYQSVAAAFKGNPYVWFGTDNEPPEVPSAGALSIWQAQTVQAIRSTGNNSIVLIEANCDGTNLCNAGYTPSSYAGMHNVVWDMHYYNWLSGYSTDQSAISTQIGALAQSAQQITSADGVMPVHVGEYGNSTTGAGIDPGGDQTVAAVINAGSVGVAFGGTTQRLGSSAWAWGSGGPGDGLTTPDGSPSYPYGQMVLLYANTSTVVPSACQVEQRAQTALNAIQAQMQQAAPAGDSAPANPYAIPLPAADPTAESAYNQAAADAAAAVAQVTAATIAQGQAAMAGH